MQDNKIAAAVVLYHPAPSFLSNIHTYYSGIDQLIVIDNSETQDDSIQENLEGFFPGANYRFLNRNAGIAAALNIACDIAIQNNCGWILTMDQDSSFSDHQFSEMRDRIANIKTRFQRVGIITPFHVLHPGHLPKVTEQYSVKKIAMTSGNLLNLEAYTETGLFEEKLFMDYVDYEYCLRLRKNKYKIIQDNFVHLKHSLGDFTIRNFFGQKIEISNHNSLRRYYITRNSLFVGFKYFKSHKMFFCHMLKNVFFLDPFKIISYEKDKLAKLKSVGRGILHFVFNRFGKAV
jgi:rhamnosyltransferase